MEFVGFRTRSSKLDEMTVNDYQKTKTVEIITHCLINFTKNVIKYKEEKLSRSKIVNEIASTQTYLGKKKEKKRQNSKLLVTTFMENVS